MEPVLNPIAKTTTSPDAPVVSVVVPVFDSEEWLPALIGSLQEQTLDRWEAILVLDGPVDGSGDIARAAASADPRIVVVETANGGAGRARNLGMRKARAEYLAFFDSDDIVPPDALERLIGSLSATGSDLVTGAALQTGGGQSGTWPYWTMKGGAHARPETGVDLVHRPELIFDHTVWNKAYRAGFLRDHAIEFPEGTTCEDLVFCARTLIAAEAVDVLAATVYVHRRRPGSVTTSGHFGDAAMNDWMTQIEACAQLIDEVADASLSSVFYQRLLRDEAWTRAAKWADLPAGAIADTLASTCARFLRSAPTAVVETLPASKRATYLMMARGAHALASLVGGTARTQHLDAANVAAVRDLVGEADFAVLAPGLAKHNLVDPVFDLDRPLFDEDDLRAATAFLRALPELDHVVLLQRRHQSDAVLRAVERGDRAALARIRFGAADPVEFRDARWSARRRAIDLGPIPGNVVERTAVWVAASGVRIEVPIGNDDRGSSIPLPDGDLVRSGVELALVLRRSGPDGLDVAARLHDAPRSRRFDRFYVRRTPDGLLVIRDRGRFVPRILKALRTRAARAWQAVAPRRAARPAAVR
ncbi:glycosyltransferase involved in cell wall biosynthesis [Agromyces terreus]|uniref:Glycosyltransferase involved in cell wall biosynthesis n=1 Tax=Agromyces terreus TaxID=424795 RepID=A0A9X2H175_9MICO|nr:glycosyltransferase [Agromyces terreus]MCP2371326.1 glycosyltransferase involved in cell wall biosynthesis [Agromyces terreus]